MNIFLIWLRRSGVIFSILMLLCAAPGLTGRAAARPMLVVGDNSATAEQSPNPSVEAGSTFQVFFAMTNTGTNAWQPGSYWFQNEEGAMGADPVQPMTGVVNPGGISIWYINLTAPDTPGTYITSWMVSHNNVDFGTIAHIEVTVMPNNLSVRIGGNLMGGYYLHPAEQRRVNYAGVDSGPVVVLNSDGTPIIAALRDAWTPPGKTAITSFAQIMGLPATQLSDTYYFPAYNNVNLDEQIRFGNVGVFDTTVTVTIGGVVRGTYFLHPSEQKRVNYAGVDSGPVVVSSSGGIKIIAAMRDAWTPPGQTGITSFVQLMGLPAGQLSTKYVFPAYNNVNLDEQIRFGNVGGAQTTVTVTIGGVVRGTYILQPNEQKRVNYAGVDSGPVVVKSSGGVKIIAAIRDAWTPPGKTAITTYAQLMGLPAELLSDQYIFPAYNNVNLDEQVRFGNVGIAQTTVTVTIGGVERGSYILQPSEQKRVNYAGLDSGPVIVSSSGGVKIIAALRDAWTPPGQTGMTSFIQLMGLPSGQLSDTYYFPSYNNVTLNEQVRFGMP